MLNIAKIAFVDIMLPDETFTLPADLNDFFAYLKLIFLIILLFIYDLFWLYFSLTYESTARIHSDSWGTPIYPFYNELARQIDEFHYTHKVFIIFLLIFFY